jgi:hypothetical protein
VNYLPVLALICDPPDIWVARITGVSHRCLVWNFLVCYDRSLIFLSSCDFWDMTRVGMKA